jgi:hypothetical protein
MRGDDQQQSGMFSYVSLEDRVFDHESVRRNSVTGGPTYRCDVSPYDYRLPK